MKLPILICILISFCKLSVWSQGTFQNLNFEAANIPPGTSPGVAISTNAAMPGWFASTTVAYDGISFGGTIITINDTNSTGFGLSGFQPLQGKYSVILFAGAGGQQGASSISQIGVVPADARSIQMSLQVASTAAGSTAGPVVVALNGQSISLSPLQVFATYIVYAGDISAYAGQTETLSISQLPNAPPFPAGSPPSGIVVDSIFFSPNSVPEPATWALMGIGTCALGWYRRRRK